jgi:hypothetical protein
LPSAQSSPPCVARRIDEPGREWTTSMIDASSRPTILETRHSFVSVEGMRLHWAEMGGANQKVPVVLLHGLNDSYLTWKRVAPELAVDQRVLMPDLPTVG